MQLTGKNRFNFAPDQLEAVNMIVNKLARIYNGDPHYADSWRDIAGYATLVADRLDNDMEQQKLIEEEMKNERDRAEVETNRGIDEESSTQREATDSAPGSDNRPTGQPELRRMPVRLEVQDGIHNSTSETQPAVRGAPGHQRGNC